MKDGKDAIFKCPWCDWHLKGPLSLVIAQKSRGKHLRECKKKPKAMAKISLSAFYWLSRRTHRAFWRQRVWKPSHQQLRRREDLAFTKATERGHEVRKTQISMWKRQRKGKCTWVCRVCLSASVGAVRNFYRKCPGKIITKGVAIWAQAKKQKILQQTMDEIGIDASKQKVIKGWIKEFTPKKPCKE